MAARIAVIATSCLLALPAMAARAGDDCTAAAPQPTLRQAAYASQSFQRRDDNQAVETANLGKGVALRIDYAGCVDAVSRTVTFHIERGRDHGRWPAFAGKRLRGLRADPARRWYDPRMLAFLSRLTGPLPDTGRIERCFDDTTPGIDGCAFETGGGFGFEVRETPTKTTVIVSQYDLI